MLLTAEKSECEKNQKIIVSRDRGSSCQHRAINDKGKSDVRQYQLDGKLVVDETCCDYLVLNDSTKSAYFIELKGSDIRTAVSQLEVTERRFRAELKGYAMFYRIIAKKMRTHELKSIRSGSFRISMEQNCNMLLKRWKNGFRFTSS